MTEAEKERANKAILGLMSLKVSDNEAYGALLDFIDESNRLHDAYRARVKRLENALAVSWACLLVVIVVSALYLGGVIGR